MTFCKPDIRNCEAVSRAQKNVAEQNRAVNTSVIAGIASQRFFFFIVFSVPLSFRERSSFLIFFHNKPVAYYRLAVYL